jgi:hypothetical protein
MWTSARFKDGNAAPYGLGWYVEDVTCRTDAQQPAAAPPCQALAGRRLVHHGGSLPGFRAQFTHLLQDSITIVVLTNSDDARPAIIARGVAELLLSAGTR